MPDPSHRNLTLARPGPKDDPIIADANSKQSLWMLQPAMTRRIRIVFHLVQRPSHFPLGSRRKRA
jgi:hypothetical protein